MKPPVMKAEEVELPMIRQQEKVDRAAASRLRADRRQRAKLRIAQGLAVQSLGGMTQGSSASRPPRGSSSSSSPTYFNDPLLPAFQQSCFSSSSDEDNESRGIDLNQDAHFSDSPVLRRTAGATPVAPTQLFAEEDTDATDAAYMLNGMASGKVRFVRGVV